jgi:hypothetical protein
MNTMQFNQRWRERNSASNPFAPPKRRFLLARKCVDEGVRPSIRNDQTTWELYRYLQYSAVSRDSNNDPHAQQFRNLEYAFELRKPKHRRLLKIVQAYALGNADNEAIGRRTGLPAETVRLYREAFFDVAHLRNCRPRMIEEVIGIGDREGNSVLDLHRLWMVVAFSLGTGALDQLLGFENVDQNGGDQGLSTWLHSRGSLALRVQFLIAAHHVNPTDPRQLQIVFAHALQEQKAVQKSADAPNTMFERHLQAMLDDLPFMVGADGAKHFEGTLLGEYDKSAAEPRDDELDSLTQNRVPESLKDVPSRLPPPTRSRPTLLTPKT